MNVRTKMQKIVELFIVNIDRNNLQTFSIDTLTV